MQETSDRQTVGRPRRGRGVPRAKRHEQLLEIARQLVAEGGPKALTMTALSELAEVGKPVIYSHFSNSAEVIIELLDLHFKKLTESVEKRLTNARTLTEYISCLVDGSFETESRSNLPVHRITNGFSSNEMINAAFLKYEDEFQKNWEDLLKHCGVSPDEAEVGGQCISGMVRNTIYSYALDPRRDIARDVLKKSLLGVIRSLSPSADENAIVEFHPDTAVRLSRIKLDQSHQRRSEKSRPSKSEANR